MLDFTKTRILESLEVAVQTGFTVTAEGQALVADYTGGVFGVRPSSSTSTDQFYGVSIAQQLTLLYLPYFETIVAPVYASTATITASQTPYSGTILVYDVTNSVALTVGAGANQYTISGNVITLSNATQSGATIQLQYRYSPTTVQASTIQGDIPPGGAASLVLGTMGCILKGQVATTEFDTTSQWDYTANPILKLTSNGLFTLASGGATVPGAVIVQLPSVTSPVLVFEI